MRALLTLSWIAALAAIALVSLLPQQAIGAVEADKLKHFAAYGVLSTLTWAAFDVRFGRGMLVAGLALAAYGLAIELLQPHVGRTFSFGDALANAVGLLFGVGVWQLIRIVAPKGLRPSSRG